jgi:hypothetical protein
MAADHMSARLLVRRPRGDDDAGIQRRVIHLELN